MDITISIPVIIALIIGISEAIKRATSINVKFIPLTDMGIGIVLCVAYSHITPITIPEIIFYGLICGLSACGLFSASKNIAQGVTSGSEDK